MERTVRGIKQMGWGGALRVSWLMICVPIFFFYMGEQDKEETTHLTHLKA